MNPNMEDDMPDPPTKVGAARRKWLASLKPGKEVVAFMYDRYGYHHFDGPLTIATIVSAHSTSIEFEDSTETLHGVCPKTG